MMKISEFQDNGIPVDDLVDNKEKLEEKGQKGDPTWINPGQFQLSEDVRAVLLKKQKKPGCVRVVANQKPTRYTLTDSLNGTVLIAAKRGEMIINLGNASVSVVVQEP
ncbi:hypothetical protein N7519_005601 [Penicillium mononematosum]|uniref:uncharacterized protein n=1 Tax=Penicillium mononematosum TaxID=268346 RepID=UPI002549A683|nr:uncharacterized protein N7519_005601 [Penicillium mononematosum]KAJ6184300.1 hypothetical protein N7519_005601 [Penicillium mononematosum]